MARTKDLWFAAVKGPDGEPVKKQTARHGNGKRWLAEWTGPDGRTVTKAFARKGEADRYGAAQETDALRGVGVSPKASRVTVAQWCDTWLTGYATRRPSTVRQARIHIAQIKSEFGALQLGAVRPSHVKTWCSRLAAEGAAQSYVYALHSRLSQILGDAVQDGVLVKNPCGRRTSPGQGKQRAYVATTDQVWSLYESMPDHLAAAVLLGAFAGLRVAESCGLRPGDVDFMRAVIHPAVQYPADPLKTEMSRTAIPVAQSMALELAAHVRRFPGPTLLVGPGGRQIMPAALDRAFRMARAGVEELPQGFRYHDLRHYFASLLIADGADVKTVQARLRHASAVTTLDTYGHLWPDRDESTRTAVEAVFLARTEQGRNTAGAP